MLIKRIDIFENLFEDKASMVSVNPEEKNLGISGDGIAKKPLGKVMKAAIGEHIERLGLYKNEFLQKNSKMTVFNFRTMKSEKIETKYVTLSLSDSHNVSEGFFSDSSGAAFQINSSKVIESAFLEFIERQSLVYSFLTKDSGEIVKITPDILEDYRVLVETFDEVLLSDISIITDIYTIIIVGIRENGICSVGLGTSRNLYDAFYKSMGEAMGSCWIYRDREKVELSTVENTTKLRYNPHYYADYFKEYATKDNIVSDYGYLREPKESANKKIRNKETIEIIRDFSSTISGDLLMAFVNVKQVYNNVKIVKFFSPDCYPHIFNNMIEPEQYKISYINTTNPVLYNKGNYLPSP